MEMSRSDDGGGDEMSVSERATRANKSTQLEQFAEL